MKRLAYLLIILAALALVVGVFYFLRYRAGEEAPQGAAPGGLQQAPAQRLPPPTQSATTTSGGAAATGTGQKFGVVAQNEVLSYFVDNQNNAVIVQPDGRIAKITRGEASFLSSPAIPSLMKAEFSYDGKKILVAFGSRPDPQYSVFDVDTKSWKPLPSGIKSAAWSPTDYRIAYIREQDGRASLATIDAADKKARSQDVMKVGTRDADIFWLSKNQIILSDKPSAFYAGVVWSVDPARKTTNPLVAEALGLDSAWSRETKLGLVFRTDRSRRGGRLSLFDSAGNALRDFSFLTLPSKCAFAVKQAAATSTPAQRFLYCAAPSDQDELSVRTVPDDYAKRSFFTQDNFYQIDLSDGNIKNILSGKLVDGDGLRIFGKNLFFINRLDGKLYAISLE